MQFYLMLVLAAAGAEGEIAVGSKAFTESVILGEMAAQLADAKGFDAVHREQLGGTQVVWNALLAGEIDVYPDYTGTLIHEVLAQSDIETAEQLEAALAERNLAMTAPLGFANNYALGVREEAARELGLETISDLKKHRPLRFGLSNEFLQRDDGWPSLRRAYDLPHRRVRGLDHTLAYRALAGGDIDVIDIYTTDANIAAYDIRVLDDDLEHFPRYDAVFLYRKDLRDRAPKFVAALNQLTGEIDAAEMIALNAAADIEGRAESRIAADFLAEVLGIGEPVDRRGRYASAVALLRRLQARTLEHLTLVILSLAAAILVALPLGVIAAKYDRLGQAILVGAEIVQTIPGLALLIFLLEPVRLFGFSGVGPAPAIVALFLYSLLPLIRNTYAGIHNIPAEVRESAEALGLTPWAQLWRIELPLASRLILAGVKTAAVINVGYATLGGLIGAGGYGQPIMEGLRRNSIERMLEGAIPAAILALLVRLLFELAERVVVPRGLRLKSG